MDRNEEARAVNALQDKVAAKHEKGLRKAIEDAMRAVAEGLPVGGRPDVPLDHFPRISQAMGALYRDITRRTAASMVDRFKNGFEWIETKATEDGFYDRLFEEYMQRYGGQRIAQISETTRAQIVRIIERGLKDGLSLDEISDEIMRSAPVIAETRAHIIARTETHSASMFASINSARRSTIPLNKEWVSAEDSRTRDFGEGDGIVDEFSHRAMDGVTVPIDDPFEVPTSFGITEQLMYPGDPAGSPANVINCRCAQAYTPVDEAGDTEEPRAAVVKPAGDERARLLDRIRGEQPVFSSANDGAMDAAPLVYLKAIAKAGDFKRLTYDKKDGAYYNVGVISMGKHNQGGEDYKRVFRHEHGHFLDDMIGKANGSPPFASWAAVEDMLEDGRELMARRSKVFDGDKQTATRIAADNGQEYLDRVDQLFDEIGGKYADADDILRQVIPEVEPDDIWRLYGAEDRQGMAAARIAAAWERRDVGMAISDIPIRLTGRVTHSSGFAGLQDTFEASNGGNVRIFFGHGKNYYTQRNSVSEFRGQVVKDGRRKINAYATGQAFANFMDAFGDPNPATYALYKRLYPRTAARFETILEEFVNA